jgi:hypothetical protein
MPESRVFYRGNEGEHKFMLQKNCLSGALTLAAFITLTGIGHSARGAEIPNYDPDISRLRKEIAQVRMERQRVREDILRDKSEQTAYQERTASRSAAYAAETDSIHRLVSSIEHKKDSLDAFIADIRLKQKNLDLLKSRFRDHIATACKKLIDAIKLYPPALSRPAVTALTFLLNDCTTKDIDNIEALQRFVQILRNLDESTLSIQTGQETSPLPAIKGSVSMLRIGAVFEALVDEDVKNAVIWQGGDSLAGGWRAISDGETASMISKAIAVRESKSLPEFIPLQWGMAPTSKEAAK